MPAVVAGGRNEFMPSPRETAGGYAIEGLYSSGEVGWVLEMGWRLTVAWMDARPEGVFWIGMGKRRSRRMTRDALLAWIATLPKWEQERRLRLLDEVHAHRRQVVESMGRAVDRRRVKRRAEA